MEKKFASHADLEEKNISFDKLSEHAYAYTAEGDPNTGIVVGDNAVMVIDTQATPVMAQDVIRRIREVTDKPIKYVVLYALPRGARARRVGLQARAHHRQPRHVRPDRRARRSRHEERDRALSAAFRAVESVPGLTWPTIMFEKRDDDLARQAGGRDHAARPRPHERRHGRLAAAGDASCSPATSSSSTRRRTPAMPIYEDWPPHARHDRRAEAPEARARPGGRADDARAGTSGARRHSLLRDGDVYASVKQGAQQRARTCEPSIARPTTSSSRSSVTGSSSSTACPSMCRAPTTSRRSTPTRASGPRSVTKRCGNRWRVMPPRR